MRLFFHYLIVAFVLITMTILVAGCGEGHPFQSDTPVIPDIPNRGDVNDNGVANEVADAVLFSNYFIQGDSVFKKSLERQIAKTDVNRNGIPLELSDLIYMIRIIVGDAIPYYRIHPVTITYQLDQGYLYVHDEIGGLRAVVEGDITPTLLCDNMEMKYHYNGQYTRILVSSYRGNTCIGRILNVDGELLEVELSDFNGNPTFAEPVVPSSIYIEQIYPNPFVGSTIIALQLPEVCEYTLSICNIFGEEVAEYSGHAEAGVFEITWDGSGQPAGVYFCRLQIGEQTIVRKLILLEG